MTESFIAIGGSIDKRQELGCLTTRSGETLRPVIADGVALGEIDIPSGFLTEGILALFFNERELVSFGSESSFEGCRMHSLLQPDQYIDKLWHDLDVRRWIIQRASAGQGIFLVENILTLNNPSIVDTRPGPALCENPPKNPSTTRRTG